jgi:N-acyl-D-aspartate/D-glutamate deacylase
MDILDGSPDYKASRYVEWVVTTVVLTNCAVVILDSVPELHNKYKDYVHEFEF